MKPKSISSEAEIQRIVARVVAALEYADIDWMKPQAFSGGLEVNGILDVSMATPELRLSERDQTDPAGRYRWIGSGDTVALQRADSASWATSSDIFNYTYSATAPSVTIRPQGSTGTQGSVSIYARSNSSTLGGQAIVYGHTHSSEPGAVVLNTTDAAGTATNTVIRLTGSTGTPQARFPDRTAGIGTALAAPPISFITDTDTGFGASANTIQVVLGGNVYWYFDSGTYQAGSTTIRSNHHLHFGDTDNDVILHRVATLAANTSLAGVLAGTPVSTAVAADSLLVSSLTAGGEIAFYVKSGANSLEMLKLLTGDTGVNIRTSATVPTTTTLASSGLRFVYNTGGGTLVAYVNDGGVIKSLSLGTPA